MEKALHFTGFTFIPVKFETIQLGNGDIRSYFDLDETLIDIIRFEVIARLKDFNCASIAPDDYKQKLIAAAKYNNNKYLKDIDIMGGDKYTIDDVRKIKPDISMLGIMNSNPYEQEESEKGKEVTYFETSIYVNTDIEARYLDIITKSKSVGICRNFMNADYSSDNFIKLVQMAFGPSHSKNKCKIRKIMNFVCLKEIANLAKKRRNSSELKYALKDYLLAYYVSNKINSIIIGDTEFDFDKLFDNIENKETTTCAIADKFEEELDKEIGLN